MYKIEKEWIEDGLHCLVVMGYAMEGIKSARCGYAGVKSNHPLFKIDYGDVPFDRGVGEAIWNVHGGLTFSGHRHEKMGVWWFGFDCSHLWDRKHIDYEDWCRKKYGDPHISEQTAQFRELDYVVRETETLARNLAKYQEEIK